MDKNQERELIEALQKAGFTYAEASEFVRDPHGMVDRLRQENFYTIVSQLKALQKAFIEQQKQIGELSAKVWRLESRLT